MDVSSQAQIHVESILQSLREIGNIILSRTLVGEEPKQLSAQAMSLLVLREEPDELARTALENEGNSFHLTSLSIQLANVTQFVDSQVGTRTSVLICAEQNFIVKLRHYINVTGHAVNKSLSKLSGSYGDYLYAAGREIVPNTGANATKFFTLATKS